MTYPGARASKIEELSNKRGDQIVKAGIAKLLRKNYRLTPNIQKGIFEWIKEGDHTQCVIDTDSLRLKLTLLPTMIDKNIPSDKCVAIRRFSKIYTSIIQLTRYEPLYTVKVSPNSKSLTDLDMNRVYFIFNTLNGDDDDPQQQDNKARLNWLIQGLIDSDVLTTVTTLSELEKDEEEKMKLIQKLKGEYNDEAEKEKDEEKKKKLIEKLEERYLDQLVKLSIIRTFQKRLTEYFKYIKEGDYIQSNLLHKSWTMDHIESRVTINANNGSLVIIQGVTRYPVGGYMKEIVHDIDEIHLRGLINK
jgi:hypothetical protein